jgi:hypothetical protein
MKAEDVTDTLQLALTASGCDQARVSHKPWLLSDNGSSYVSADSLPVPRKPEELDACQCLLRARSNHPVATRKDQTRHHPETTIAASIESSLNSNPDEPNTPRNYAANCLKAFDDGNSNAAGTIHVRFSAVV